MSRRRCDGKAFHTRGPAAENLLSSMPSCVRWTTHILSDADRSWERPVSPVCWMSEARYDGVCPVSDWWTRHASLNSTLRRTGSQCNFWRTGVMHSHRRVPVIRRAAAFCMDWTIRLRFSHCTLDVSLIFSLIWRGHHTICPVTTWWWLAYQLF